MLIAQIATTQVAPHEKPKPKGPRALGLLEILPKGKARLTPVVIMIDGSFYDASAYKAAPVPMALYTDTVYEGFRDGVSQGLFTVKGALAGPNNTWKAEGTWQTASEIAAKAKKKPEPTKPRGLEDDRDAPPVLHRAQSAKSPEPANQSAPTAVSAPAAPSTTAPSATSPAPSASATSSSTPLPEATPAETRETNDPVLRRGKLTTPSSSDIEIAPAVTSVKPGAGSNPPASSATPAKISAPASAPTESVQLLPAISDAHAVESHSYEYPLKTGEEQAFRKKMLALATEEVRARDQQLAAETTTTVEGSSHRGKTAGKPVALAWDGVQLRIFDLSGNNEPVLILTATVPEGQINGTSKRQYDVTLVAREDVYGDLHKAFSSITDAQHLDVLPKMELIDAVDVDGDGRAELLFRQTYDSGTAFVVYRVIGQQLYALFQGTPSGP